ncbi:LOB domain-containing protein 19 [Hibiscus trionum]|uniref:LOB domain-containing protein 19 n=1 Tax=Hibiscus trionum TaxID=183268 RepID=A0A9W7H9T6_HIBTR|nr:LOB domain-containing protein 19 [Hibiscus trionum]
MEMMMSAANNGGAGPCGACKFLRRKCVKGCIFAPYFSSDQGTAHFAAVHKVFGASNASKILQGIPGHKRLDAVVTLCYEALARVRDPVYGSVGHIFTLQQQVVNLQAELAHVHAHISTLRRVPLTPQSQALCPHFLYASEIGSEQYTCMELSDFPIPSVQEMENQEELQALAREFPRRSIPAFHF